MPPRYVYWTIIVDGQPTAFRSGSLEDIMPTFNRLKEKQPTAELKWWQHGQLWSSRHDAQEFMQARGERGRARDPRQADDPDNPKPERAWNAKPEWKTRSSFKPRGEKPAFAPRSTGAPARLAASKSDERPEWKPKGSLAAAADRPRAPRKSFGDRDDKPSWKDKGDKPAWKPKDEAGGKPEWKPKGSFKPKEAGHRDADSGFKPAWKPASGKPTARRAPGSSWGDDDRPAKTERQASGSSWGEGEDRPAGQARSDRKPEWKPKGTFKPKEAGHSSGWGEKPGFKSSGAKPAWKGKPSGSPRDQARSSFRPKSYTPKDEGDGPTRSSRARDQKLEWNPASAKASARQAPDARPAGPNSGFAKSDPDAPKRKWVPKAEYKKSMGIEAKKDAKWRPGGDHVDPKQKYKDAKKAKWGRFKEAIRSRSAKPKK